MDELIDWGGELTSLIPIKEIVSIKKDYTDNGYNARVRYENGQDWYVSYDGIVRPERDCDPEGKYRIRNVQTRDPDLSSIGLIT